VSGVSYFSRERWLAPFIDDETGRVTGGVSVRGASGRSKKFYEFTAYFFILPTLVILGLYSAYPLLYSVVMSFFNWNFGEPGATPVFVGLSNYASMWQDENFLVSLKNSFVFSTVTISLEFILGLWFAVLLSKEMRGNSIFRSIYLIPLAITPIVTGYLWRMIFNPANGLVNYLLGILKLPPKTWIAEPRLAFFTICFVDIWEWTPFVMIIFVAALKSIPPEFGEAARVDGANRWQLFWRISFPIMFPVVIVTMLLRFIDSFKVFDTIYALTGGGPGISTEVLGLYIYKQGLKYFYVGRTSAVVIVFVLIIFVTAFFAIRRTLRVS
jgi:multiple sugar transport system permease protein